MMFTRFPCPSRRTPMAASTEISVALRSIRVLITEPSRISRMISSSARLRAPHAFQSVLTLRQGGLPHSCSRPP